MMRMGPEALLVTPTVDPRVALAEFAVRDSTREGVRAVKAMLRRELEYLPVRRTAAQRLMRWGRKRLRRDDLPLAAAPALVREAAVAPAKTHAVARVFAGAALAAMGRLRAGARPKEAGALVAAAPVYARH